MAAVGLLHLLAGPEQLRLVIGHVDHGLRAESASEADLVASLAQRLGLEFHQTVLELDRGPGLPARARTARREALDHFAVVAQANAVVLGHTATDQAETMLLNLARGCGLDGLSAMAGVDKVWSPPRLRPLLGIAREQTRALCNLLALGFVDDPTNQDASHPRIAIRSRVLPELCALRSGATDALCAMAQTAREAEDALMQWTITQLQQRRMSDDSSRYNIRGIGELPRAIQTRFVVGVSRRAGLATADLGRRVVSDICDSFARLGPHRTWDLHGRYRAVVSHDVLWIEPPTT